MKVQISVVGKTKELWCNEGEMKYAKLLKKFCHLEYSCVPEEKILPSISDHEVKKKEGKRILASIPQGFYTIALSQSGKQVSSENFAKFLRNLRDHKGGKVCFCIGGPLGLSNEVLQGADMILSFSSLTFPHDISRIVLFEQLYRGFSILSGSKYHKS